MSVNHFTYPPSHSLSFCITRKSMPSSFIFFRTSLQRLSSSDVDMNSVRLCLGSSIICILPFIEKTELLVKNIIPVINCQGEFKVGRRDRLPAGGQGGTA